MKRCGQREVCGLKCGLKPSLRAWQEGVRAEARPEGVDAPAGLGCLKCGLKPSLKAWKPLPGWGVRGWRRRRGGVRAEARPEDVEAPAGLGRVGGARGCAG